MPSLRPPLGHYDSLDLAYAISLGTWMPEDCTPQNAVQNPQLVTKDMQTQQWVIQQHAQAQQLVEYATRKRAVLELDANIRFGSMHQYRHAKNQEGIVFMPRKEQQNGILVWRVFETAPQVDWMIPANGYEPWLDLGDVGL